jgi:hypothetical protein
MVDSVSDYPHWLVVACAVLATVVALWLVLKLIKLALWLLLVGLVLASASAVIWLLFR